MIYIKIHQTEGGKIVAMCDETLIGRVLKEGNIVIDVKGYSDFYKGTLITTDQFKDVSTKGMVSANVVGKESISAAIGRKVIEHSHVKMVQGIPYAHAYKIDY